MKRKADWQVREEDEKAIWQTGSLKGWKGNLTDRFGKRMKRQAERIKRQADGQVREEDEMESWEDEKASWQTGSRTVWKHSEKEAWVQDGKTNWQTGLWEWRTNWETGLWTGWKDIFREREFEKGRKEKQRDRLLKRMEDKLKLRDRLMSRNDGQIKRQTWEKDGKTNWVKRPAF